MKTVERISTERQAEKLAEDKKDDLFTQMVMGMDATEKVETSRGVFTLKYPRAADLMLIGRIAARRRDYKPAESFDPQTEAVNIMASTLDVMAVSGPKWYEDAKALNRDFSFMEVPSQEFLAELYVKARSFRGEVERRFGEEEKPAAKRVPAEENADEAVGGGAFGNLSYEPDGEGA
ncbi:MAG: hypothetical protein FWG66_11105 [Spirochaetes bacterium]|nr:hypothetical protein [Spirochaetota bacterium]